MLTDKAKRKLTIGAKTDNIWPLDRGQISRFKIQEERLFSQNRVAYAAETNNPQITVVRSILDWQERSA